MCSLFLKRWATLLPGFALLLVLVTGAGAQGILYPALPPMVVPPHDIRPFPPRPIWVQPFYVKNLRVDTTITDSVAETTVEQTFVNISSVVQEGTYLYPLPEGASPTSFSMTVGDKTLEPRILTHDEAHNIYESIVRRYRDPALLEYVDRNLVKISVYPIPPQGERVIRMRYTEVLKPENGLHKYAYSLSTSRFGARPVGTSSVSIRLRTNAALKNVYSPSHDLSIRRPDDRTATASWEGANEASDRDLTLYYSTSNDDVGLSLLTYRSGDRDGYFMLLASPRVVVPAGRILPKEVVFVLDRTGSMAGKKIEQARKSLLYCLNSMHSQDRFDVITFNESPDILTRSLMPATDANLVKARRFVENIDASGGTNIDEALQAALGLLKHEAGTQKMVVFLTDGLPTIGETDINTILNHVKQVNGEQPSQRTVSEPHVGAIASLGADARIFCFGMGYDVNVPFLDRLSDVGRGDADYIKPEEDVEAKVSSFFAKVTSPILSNLRLAIDGADVYDVYPKVMPDLFKGSQLVITGRFRGNGNGTVQLSGLANGSPESFHTGGGFSEADASNNFLPRIWAARKIGYLADQIRLSNNPSGRQEVIDEIVRLSREYGIITEYTSFLVDDQEQRHLGLRDANGSDLYSSLSRERFRSEIVNRAGRNGIQGEAATDQSLRSKDLAKADKAPSRYQTGNGGVYTLNQYAESQASGPAGPSGIPGIVAGDSLNFGYGRAGGYGGGFSGAGGARGGANHGGVAQGLLPNANKAISANTINLQAVADRTFYRQANNVWQDSSFDPKQQTIIEVQAFSDAHFALLRALPKLAAYSSVGEELIVRLGRNAVLIGKNGKTSLTPAELKQLTDKG